MNYMPENYKLALALMEVLVIEVDTRSRIIAAIWHYVKARKLQNPDDPSYFNYDPALRKVFREDKMKFTMVWQKISHHLSPPPQPIQLEHKIKLSEIVQLEMHVMMYYSMYEIVGNLAHKIQKGAAFVEGVEAKLWQVDWCQDQRMIIDMEHQISPKDQARCNERIAACEISPYLSEAARCCTCSHDGPHNLFFSHALANLSPTLKGGKSGADFRYGEQKGMKCSFVFVCENCYTTVSCKMHIYNPPSRSPPRREYGGQPRRLLPEEDMGIVSDVGPRTRIMERVPFERLGMDLRRHDQDQSCVSLYSPLIDSYTILYGLDIQYGAVALLLE
nr:hypothetical protein [Tanacetum cinerariifolium]